MTSMPKSCIVAWGANLKKYIISEEKEHENDNEIIHNISSKSSVMAASARKYSRLRSSSKTSPRPDWDESPPQTQHPPLAHCLPRAIDEAIVKLDVGGLVHQLRAQHVGRRHGHGHEETGDERAREGRPDVLPPPTRRLRDVSLRDVVHAHLGRVEYARADDVDLHPAVESLDALIAVHVGDEGGEAHPLVGVRLGEGLAYVEGVADDGACAAGERSREEFEHEGGVGGVLAGAEEIAHGRV